MKDWPNGYVDYAISGVACSVLLCLWGVLCISDVNHPPGVRWVRLATFLFVVGLGLLEIRYPWKGVMAFLCLWPFMHPIREVLTEHVTVHFSALPMFWSGPAASSLAIALAIKNRRHFNNQN